MMQPGRMISCEGSVENQATSLCIGKRSVRSARCEDAPRVPSKADVGLVKRGTFLFGPRRTCAVVQRGSGVRCGPRKPSGALSPSFLTYLGTSVLNCVTSTYFHFLCTVGEREKETCLVVCASQVPKSLCHHRTHMVCVPM
jgi:hypothetical protein